MNEFTKVGEITPGGANVPIKSTLQQEERELASRLRATIDRNGRYSYRLDDMAAGFAAGRGISPTEARRNIENVFQTTYSRSPKEYMDQRFKDRYQGPAR